MTRNPRSRSALRAYSPDMPAPTTMISASSSMSVDSTATPSGCSDGTSVEPDRPHDWQEPAAGVGWWEASHGEVGGLAGEPVAIIGGGRTTVVAPQTGPLSAEELEARYEQ